MIHTENLVTTVKFGNTEKASIGVLASNGILSLQMLSSEKKIGETITVLDTKELPKIKIEFFDTKSIDVMIEALQVIKKNATPPHYDYSLAC